METNIEKRIGAGIWPLRLVEEEAGHSKESAKFLHMRNVMSSNIFDEGYLTRLRSGDEDTAKHFWRLLPPHAPNQIMGEIRSLDRAERPDG